MIPYDVRVSKLKIGFQFRSNVKLKSNQRTVKHSHYELGYNDQNIQAQGTIHYTKNLYIPRL